MDDPMDELYEQMNANVGGNDVLLIGIVEVGNGNN